MQKTLIKSILILLLITSTAQNNAYAEDFSLGIYPTLSKILAKNNSTVSINIELENFSDKPISLSPTFKEFKATDKQNGYIELIPNSIELTKLLDKAVILHEGIPITQITLAPSQKLNLELQIPVTKDTANKDFTFSTIFIDNRTTDLDLQNPSSISYLKGGIATNVILSVGENENPQAIIEEFSTQSIFQQGPIPFTLIIRNPGQHLISPSAVITIRNMFGHLVGKIELDEENILANSRRILTMHNENIDNKSQSNQLSNSSNILPGTIAWPEKFLLGPYQANLQLSVSSNGPVYTRSIYFLAFPYKSISIIICSIIFILFIVKRVSKHLSS